MIKTMKIICRYFLCSIIILPFVSCERKEQTLLQEISTLKNERDSLSLILDEINKNKYVFDNIELMAIPDCDNSFKANSNYQMNLFLAAYNSNSKFFISNTSLNNEQIVNPDTLKNTRGTFKYSMQLNDDINPISIKVNVENKFGKKIQGILSDRIKVKGDGGNVPD